MRFAFDSPAEKQQMENFWRRFPFGLFRVRASARALAGRFANAQAILTWSEERPNLTVREDIMDRYAEILEQAIPIFGSKEAAEDWMNRPAIGLDRRKPIDLICVSAEARMVETYLKRLDYGVYC